MQDDDIVSEVRHARESLARSFNYELRAMIEDARRCQALGGREIVSFHSRSVGESVAGATVGEPAR